MKRLPVLLLLLLIPTLSSWSHLNSLSYSLIDINDKEVHIELRLTLICMLELFTVDIDGDLLLTQKELEPVKPVMYYYLNNKLKILSGGQQLRMELKTLDFSVEEDDSYVTVDLYYPRPKPSSGIVILNNVLEETDPFHRNIAEIKTKGKESVFIFTNANYFDTRAMPPADRKANPAVIQPATKTQ